MSRVSLKDASRRNWHAEANENGYPGDENIKIGCLQRIADSAETMAKSYDHMREDRDWWREKAQRCRAREEACKRSNAALRGRITKLEKQIAVLNIEKGTMLH
jgi:hypothetical protein